MTSRKELLSKEIDDWLEMTSKAYDPEVAHARGDDLLLSILSYFATSKPDDSLDFVMLQDRTKSVIARFDEIKRWYS